MKRIKNRQDSGQILVIAVLVVSLVLLSTLFYIYEIARPLEEESINVHNFVFSVKLGSKHTIISSLANISVGGNRSFLSANLERWRVLVNGLYGFGKPILNFELGDTSPYINGTYLSWGIDGFGISSVYVDVDFSLSDSQVDTQMFYSVNVTSSLWVDGVYQAMIGSVKHVNVTCNLFNEGYPALAENVVVLYENSGSWQRADEQANYCFIDYGNGTYFVSFEADILEENVNVSAQVHDLRGIYIQANATCTNVT